VNMHIYDQSMLLAKGERWKLRMVSFIGPQLQALCSRRRYLS
jgi:hypothetical protein